VTKPRPRNLTGIRQDMSRPTEAWEQRQRRAGRLIPVGSRAQRIIPRPIRNGLPWKPYTYRGLGYDQLTGEADR
jgi:hypothetical protein